MQATSGAMRKRKKRNILKVKGRGVVPYDEVLDKFEFLEPQTFIHSTGNKGNSTLRVNRDNETVVRPTSSFKIRRVTRDPLFHMEEGNLEDIELDYQEKIRRFSSQHEAIPQSAAAPTKTHDDHPTLLNGSTMNRLLDYQEKIRRFSSQHQAIPESAAAPTKTHDDHPTLLNGSTMNRLRLIVGLGMISGALPWYWNPRKNRIEQYRPAMRKLWFFQWTMFTGQTIALLFFQLRMFIISLSGEISSYRGVFMGSLSVYWYFIAVVFRFIVYSGQEKMRAYINTMLRFNSDYIEKYLLHLEGYHQGGMIVMNLSIPATCFQIGSSLASFLLLHSQPWYLTSYFPTKPWYWLIPGAFHDIILVGSDITIYMLMGWMVIAHTNSVDFWLQEIHNSVPTDFTSDDLRNPLTATATFRSLSILNATFNDCMALVAIPMLKLTVWLGIIICGYVLVRSMNHLFIEEFPSILLYPIGIINCSAMGFGFISMSAQMCDFGVSFVDSWSRTKHKNFRRILISCRSLKVNVGGLYYITVATIVTFFRIITDQIINLIITFP